VLRNTVAIRTRQIDESRAQMTELTAAMDKTKANIEARLGTVTRLIQRYISHRLYSTQIFHLLLCVQNAAGALAAESGRARDVGCRAQAEGVCAG
jgi:hypothetical protein